MLKTLTLCILVASLVAGCSETKKRKYNNMLMDAALGPELAAQTRMADAQSKAAIFKKGYDAAKPTTHPISHRKADKVYKVGDYIVELRNIDRKPGETHPDQFAMVKQVKNYVVANKLCPITHHLVELYDEPIPLYDPVKKTAGFLVMCFNTPLPTQ